jgi:hypothetical protein
MEADLSKRDVRTDHSLHGRRAAGYPHQTSRLMLTILAGVATWQREIMLEPHCEGIAKAKAEGKYKGRPAHIDAARSSVCRLIWVRRPSLSNSVSLAAPSTGY